MEEALASSDQVEAPGLTGEGSQETSELAENPEETLQKHQDHITKQALILFDRTRPLHGLDEDSRRLLEQAAMTYGRHISLGRKKTHQAAVKWVEAHAPVELSSEDQKALAAIIAYNQGKLKKKHFTSLTLSPVQQRQVLTIISILRIAAGLDDSNSQQTFIQQVEPARDGMLIVVDGPQAVADATIAQQQARLWEKIGYPKVTVLESTEAAAQFLPFPTPTSSIGLTPTDTLSEAGRKVMRYHFAQMLRHEEGTRLGEDIEALHDMRVATRRLRAAFEVFKDAFEPGVMKPHLKGLRAIGRALGSVRDLDVFMEKAEHYLQTLPEEQRNGLDPLLESWHAQRETARAAMIAHMDSPEYLSFKRNFNIFLSTPNAGAKALVPGGPAPTLVRELAPVLIYQRLAAVRAFDPLLHNAPIETLHALRIEFKKLRYTVEYFREVLGKQSQEVIDELKSIQDHLGDLNDAQVATQILRQFIDEWEPQQDSLPIAERKNIQAIVSYMATRHAERHALMTSFPKVWRHFTQATFRRNLAAAVSAL